MKWIAIGLMIGTFVGSGTTWFAVVVPERTRLDHDLVALRSRLESEARIDALTLKAEFAAQIRALERERDGFATGVQRLRGFSSGAQSPVGVGRHPADTSVETRSSSTSRNSLDEIDALIDRVGELGRKTQDATDPFVDLKSNWTSLGESWNKPRR